MNKIDRKETDSNADRMTKRPTDNFRLIKELAELQQIAADWDRLASSGQAPSPFKSAAWVITFFECRLHPGQSWACIAAEREGKLLAVLPLVIIGEKSAHSPADYHTYSVEPVLATDESPELLVDMLQFASDQLPEIFEFAFTRLPEGAVLLEAKKKDSSGCRSILAFDGVGNVIPAVGDYDSYRAGFNRNFHRNLKKSANRIEKLGEVEAVFETDGTKDGLLERFLKIEASGWKSREESAIASDDNLVVFYRKLIERFSANGWFEWQFLQVGIRALAGNLAIRFNERIFLVKIGYDEEYARLAPGSRLMELVLQRAFDDPQTEVVDLLTDMEWHANWHPESIEYYNLYFYPPRGNSAFRKRKFSTWLRKQSWLVTFVRTARGLMGRKA